jgi:hypothetical protein
MGTTLGIGMIEMYTKMIKDDFAPIISQLNARCTVERANMEITVRKELGIYNLTVKKFKLAAELGEVERQLKTYEATEYNPKTGRSHSKIDKVIDAKMAERKNGLFKETETLRNDLVKRVKLAGVHGDIKNVFDKVPALLASLEASAKKLAPIRPLKKLSAK